MSTRFDPVAVRQALPPFDIGVGLSSAESIQHYLQFYLLHTYSQQGIQHDLGVVDAAGFRIAVQHFKPAQLEGNPSQVKGTVWVVHGYTDHVGNFSHLILTLVKSGFEVMIYDLPGHGLSDGDPVAIDDFSQYRAVLLALMEHFGPKVAAPHFAVGQSTGAAILMDTLLSPPFLESTSEADRQALPWEKVVLMAPLLRIPLWWQTRLHYWLVKSFKSRVKRQFRANSSDDEFVEFLKTKDPLQTHYITAKWVGAMFRWADRMELIPEKASNAEVLVIQGEQDKTVDYKYNIPCIESRFPNAEVEYFPQASHHLVNETQVLRDQMFDRLKGFLS